MDKLLSTIHEANGDLERLCSYLRGCFENISRIDPESLDIALNTLNPATHSLGYTFILAAKAQNSERFEHRLFFEQAVNFLSYCDGRQVKYAPDLFSSICQALCHIAISAHSTVVVIRPLQRAILALQPHPDNIIYLTPIHAELYKVCLKAKMYTIPLAFLTADPIEVNPRLTGIKLQDIRLCYYYGALLYIGMKKFKEAAQYFVRLFACATQESSAVLVEAYKKYVLVSLLASAEVPSLSKILVQIQERRLHKLCRAYEEVAVGYKTHNAQELQTIITRNQAVFQSDRNMGLVKQVLASLNRLNIQRLTQTYLTLSLSDIASAARLGSAAEAEREILHMIAAGQIHATVSQADGMVAFLEEPEGYDTNATLQKLDGMMDETFQLQKRIEAVQREIICDPNYIRKSMIQEKHGRWTEPEDGLMEDKPSPNLRQVNPKMEKI
eukprot:TRINITY_DN7609_c0_g1::TRINITY_DN7609_c0_g1_i1::g.1957::m.1957 TRINITY_DN7609_c0_g1::TRINITY_DN7609_c0_g1_i1::g.1957  ORF type:complete len:441 (-),score=108.31,sp/A6H7B5/CSN3_BOVIN/34.64/1e-78,PCI/PF01399.22/1.2e-11,DUF155/PF02582.9/0.034 TRINITY_DN7609_c0_g1_i1:415-1737(-)